MKENEVAEVMADLFKQELSAMIAAYQRVGKGIAGLDEALTAACDFAQRDTGVGDQDHYMSVFGIYQNGWDREFPTLKDALGSDGRVTDIYCGGVLVFKKIEGEWQRVAR
jgi:hypothetical protein